MTKEELLEYIDSWENLPYLLNEITKTPEFYLMLIEIALYNCNQKSWRAAYLIDKINDNYPQLLQPFLNEMIDQVKIEKSHSKKRHFLKLIGQNELPPEQQGFMLDFCMISEKEPELKPEILVLIEYEMENHSSAGIVSRGRKLAQNLRNQIG
jgi:hypothetical protein